MSESTKPAALPPFLFNAWRFGQHYEGVAKKNNELDDWTVSSLVEAYFKFQLDTYKALEESRTRKLSSSLFSITAGHILEELNNSDNLEADVKAIAESVNPTTLQNLLRDPRSTYRVIRAFHSLPSSTTGTRSGQSERSMIDVDESILRNERFVRSRSNEENKDGKYLVGLNELCNIVKASPDGTYWVKFTRKDPPKGGFEFLDEYRDRVMRMQPTNEIFVGAFEYITEGALRGLDWSNVLVAGGKVLSTLTGACDVKESDIDIYLYGLDVDQANRKVKHIYKVWSDNLPAGSDKLVVKNSKTINLLPSYPHCRVQIVLKLVSSPTQVLLNFDLDACAIAFDGSHVLMLPRCARAIETGYSVFTMDLIWGHHLNDRRATQQSRVFKYADRGFGLRIVPSYVKSLEEDDLERQTLKDGHKAVDDERANDVWSKWAQRDRKPDGPKEPGLKTLKRIAYLGRDYVQRFYFGTTPLAVFPNHPSRFQSEDPDGGDHEWADETEWGVHAHWDSEEAWKEAFAKAEKYNIAKAELKRRKRAAGEGPSGPTINLCEMDTRAMRNGLPDGLEGLAGFELFMRHCEAYRLDFEGLAFLDRSISSRTTYDDDSYDELPTYTWGPRLQLGVFKESLDNYNNSLFNLLKEAIHARLPGNLFAPDGGFRNYLTRRIRRQVHGPDIDSVMGKQITIPLVIPWDLENYFLTRIPQEFPDLPRHLTRQKPLIPVHDTSKHNPTTAHLPSLEDDASEVGNMRYWVITNQSMWAGQHRAVDETAEILWCLFYWFTKEVTLFLDTDPALIGTQQKSSLWHVTRYCRRRIILPDIPVDNGFDHRVSTSSMGGKSTATAAVPTIRESLLFRPWAFHTPMKPRWEHVNRVYNHPPHDLFDEFALLYPFPDHLFWNEGDEGEWDDYGAPRWSVVKEEGKGGKVGVKIQRDRLRESEDMGLI